ncbi:MAG: hypothetical protein QOF02_2899 [Blastocatellia bacterium]|jgi:hypothetical protein|nr:hypothetical protein [Blastocatellia bacterium]
MYNEVVQELFGISEKLSNIDDADTRTITFVGWHEGFDDPNAPQVREAAKAILASGLTEDEGTKVPLKSIAALLGYIAAMMEE